MDKELRKQNDRTSSQQMREYSVKQPQLFHQQPQGHSEREASNVDQPATVRFHMNGGFFVFFHMIGVTLAMWILIHLSDSNHLNQFNKHSLQ